MWELAKIIVVSLFYKFRMLVFRNISFVGDLEFYIKFWRRIQIYIYFEDNNF